MLSPYRIAPASASLRAAERRPTARLRKRQRSTGCIPACTSANLRYVVQRRPVPRPRSVRVVGLRADVEGPSSKDTALARLGLHLLREVLLELFDLRPYH